MAKEPNGRIVIPDLSEADIEKTRAQLMATVRVFIVGGDVHHNPSDFVAMVHSLRALDMIAGDKSQ